MEALLKTSAPIVPLPTVCLVNPPPLSNNTTIIARASTNSFLSDCLLMASQVVPSIEYQEAGDVGNRTLWYVDTAL